jgi:tRNA(adenine34) deaminase
MSESLRFPFMHQALHMAQRAFRRQEIPVGAVIVHKDRILAYGHNYVESWKQPLAHAEILCVLQAQKRLKSKYLSECALYVTLQPCALCQQILTMVRIPYVYFGAYDTSLPVPCLDMIGGIHEHQCAALLNRFFQNRRADGVHSGDPFH